MVCGCVCVCVCVSLGNAQGSWVGAVGPHCPCYWFPYEGTLSPDARARVWFVLRPRVAGVLSWQRLELEGSVDALKAQIAQLQAAAEQSELQHASALAKAECVTVA